MKTLIFTISMIFLCLGLLAQDPGDLNMEFASGGIFTEHWDDTITQVYGIGMLPDGNLVLPGYYTASASPAQQIFVMKMDEQGNIPSFGNCSRGFRHQLCSYEFATAIITTPDNKLLIAGNYTPAFSEQPFVIRVNSGGEIDETFAENGVFTNDGINMSVLDIEVYGDESDYNIILCGQNDGEHPQIIMINEDGDLETSFNSTGILSYDTYIGSVVDVIADNENNHLYTCIALGGSKAALLKYNLPEGSLDPAFGVGGILSSTVFEDIELTFNAIVLNKDSDLLTSFGNYRHPDGDLDICAFRVKASNGSVDMSFGLNGWAWVRSASSDEDITTAVQQSDGKYYVGGYTDLMGMDDFMLGRLKFNGTADNTFGTNGLVITEDWFDEQIAGLALSPSEDILYAAGYSFSDDWRAMMIAAYHTGYVPEEQPVGIDENLTSLLNLYPNPVMDKLTIKTGQVGIHSVRILDMAGKIRIEKNYEGESLDLNLNELLPSVYFIEVTLPDMQVITEKIIKQ